MNSDLVIIDEPQSFYLGEITASAPETTGSSAIEFKISVNNMQEIFAFTVNVSEFKEIIRFTYYKSRKNELQILAIKNLIKISNSLQLNLQFSEKTISDQEFEEALEKNPEHYIVDVRPIEDEGDVIIIGDILQEVAPVGELESDQVANIFSIEHDSLLKVFQHGKMLPGR